MDFAKQFTKIKTYLRKNGNRGAMKMSNFGSIIMITFLATACAYYLVGGSLLTLADPTIDKLVIPTAVPSPLPTPLSESTGGPNSISVTVGCSEKGTVTFTFALTDPKAPTYNITVNFPNSIPKATFSLAGGQTKVVDISRAAEASGTIYFDGLPDGKGPKTFPTRVCSIPTPTPTP